MKSDYSELGVGGPDVQPIAADTGQPHLEDPRVVLSLLEADQVVAAKEQMRFGRQKLSPRSARPALGPARLCGGDDDHCLHFSASRDSCVALDINSKRSNSRLTANFEILSLNAKMCFAKLVRGSVANFIYEPREKSAVRQVATEGGGLVCDTCRRRRRYFFTLTAIGALQRQRRIFRIRCRLRMNPSRWECKFTRLGASIATGREGTEKGSARVTFPSRLRISPMHTPWV